MLWTNGANAMVLLLPVVCSVLLMMNEADAFVTPTPPKQTAIALYDSALGETTKTVGRVAGAFFGSLAESAATFLVEVATKQEHPLVVSDYLDLDDSNATVVGDIVEKQSQRQLQSSADLEPSQNPVATKTETTTMMQDIFDVATKQPASTFNVFDSSPVKDDIADESVAASPQKLKKETKNNDFDFMFGLDFFDTIKEEQPVVTYSSTCQVINRSKSLRVEDSLINPKQQGFLALMSSPFQLSEKKQSSGTINLSKKVRQQSSKAISSRPLQQKKTSGTISLSKSERPKSDNGPLQRFLVPLASFLEPKKKNSSSTTNSIFGAKKDALVEQESQRQALEVYELLAKRRLEEDRQKKNNGVFSSIWNK